MVVFDANTIASLVEIDFPEGYIDVIFRGDAYPIKISFNKVMTVDSSGPEFFQLLNICLRNVVDYFIVYLRISTKINNGLEGISTRLSHISITKLLMFFLGLQQKLLQDTSVVSQGSF